MASHILSKDLLHFNLFAAKERKDLNRDDRALVILLLDCVKSSLDDSGAPRAFFEQQNQKLCYKDLKDKIVAKNPLTSKLVCEIHRVLTSGSYDERPGEYKIRDDVTGRGEADSPAEDVAGEVGELLGEINSYETQDIIRAAAYFHAVFENIPPFAAGNGRVGQTLLNYCLIFTTILP